MTSETESSAEISYFWRVTSQSVMVLLIGFRFVSSNQKHYRPLGSDASSVWSFCARFSNVISWGNQWWCREISALFSVYLMSSTTLSPRTRVRPQASPIMSSLLVSGKRGELLRGFSNFHHFLEIVDFSTSLSRRLHYLRNFCNLIGLEQWYFCLIWNTYMWKLQTFSG